MNGCQFFSHQYFNDCLHIWASTDTESVGSYRSRLKRRLRGMQLAVSGNMVCLWQWVSALALAAWKSSEAGILRLSGQSNRQPTLPSDAVFSETALFHSKHTANFSPQPGLFLQYDEPLNSPHKVAHHVKSVSVQRTCPMSTRES